MLHKAALAALAMPALLFFGTVADHHPAAPAAFVVAPAGNEIRYRVREQLAGFDLPNDAIGRASTVTGSIAFDAAGKLVPADSKIIADVTQLVSDRTRRDGYIRSRVLEMEQFPTVTLAATSVKDLGWPLPTTGSRTFELIGDLTVHGTTRPTTWHVTAAFANGEVTGTARTAFTFADFSLTQPRVPIVLSVADTIGLEYDFHLVPKP